MRLFPVPLVLFLAAAALAQPAAAVDLTVTIPASASLHGATGAFVHSDMWVMNRSFANAIPVTARFRCFTGPCPSAPQATFTLAAREQKLFSDVLTTLFAAPETAGAIELTWDSTLGNVSASSRVYTPQLPAATFGADIPGFASSEASTHAFFLGLGNNGGDMTAGFRSNVGAYNPDPVQTATLTFQLYAANGAVIGIPVTRNLGPQQAMQINDIFQSANAGTVVSNDVTLGATSSVQAFFNVTVIDNQSGDSVYVLPSSAATLSESAPDIQSVPASASVHGLNGTFFHTDLWARNGSPTESLAVAAVLRCSFADCEDRSTTFTLAPGETRLYADVLASLFGAPGTAGAISLTPGSTSGSFTFPKLTVTTRTYTPALPAPTKGTAIPGLTLNDIKQRALFLGIAGSGGDGTTGFRSNAGAYNALPFNTTATFSLYDATGHLLGKKAMVMQAYQAAQINDIFAAVGAGGVVTTNAYLVISAGLPVFGYVTVIDNKSGDSIFVRASSDEAPPQ
jgi:hypothetical protein